MEASEMLESVLCDQVGRPCIKGSLEDLRIIAAAIDMVKRMEGKLGYGPKDG